MDEAVDFFLNECIFFSMVGMEFNDIISNARMFVCSKLQQHAASGIESMNSVLDSVKPL